MFEAIVRPLEQDFSGNVSVAYYDFRSGSSFLHNATETMRAASLIKLPILLCALTEVARENRSLHEKIKLTRASQVGGAGILHLLESGLEFTFQDLLTLMIVVSDNTATNSVIGLLGLEEINAYIQNLGLQQTKLVGKLQLARANQNDAQRQGQTNQCSAADILGTLIQLEKGDLLPHDLSVLALGILKKQQFTEALARYLPTDKAISKNALQVASKSGCLRGLWHDAAIIYDVEGKPLYSLVIMTDESEDKSYSWEQEGMMLIARISREIYRQII